MMKWTRGLWLAVALLALVGREGFSFIPPLPALLKEIMEGRKGGPLEIVFRHRLGNTEFEERVVAERGRYHLIWRGGNFQTPVAASWERQAYFIGDRQMSSRSGIFLKYFGSASSDELKDALVAEQFLRRDQMLQYKPGYVPAGDPQTWEIRENYLRHPDIFLQRMRSGIAIVAVGIEEGVLRKAVYFDRGLKGIRRLEWRDGQEAAAWNFESFSSFPAGGDYPKRLVFELNGNEIISSELIAVRPIRDRALSDFRNSWKQVSSSTTLSPTTEAVLQRLLSFR